MRTRTIYTAWDRLRREYRSGRFRDSPERHLLAGLRLAEMLRERGATRTPAPTVMW